MANNSLNGNYKSFLEDLKSKVGLSRYQAAISINKELINLYHFIGSQILLQQQKNEWGSKVISQLSKDLRDAFPDMKGFSPQNLKYMKKFAEEYADDEIEKYHINQIPWGHNVAIMYSIKDKTERIFYIEKTRAYGWSRNVLEMQISTNLYNREGKALTNFHATLPSPHSDLARATLKNPYIFDFLSLGKEAQEREVERALIDHIERFLLELGEGFAFIGRQYHLEVDGEDFYLDLLFYHVKIKSYVVVGLKSGQFKPEYAGKMNFYLSAVDDLLRSKDDNPSIGLILCRSKLGIKAEYALRDMAKPIGLAEYKLTASIPEDIKTALPTIESLEEELAKEVIPEDE